MVEIKVGDIWQGVKWASAKVKITYVGQFVVIGENVVSGAEHFWTSPQNFRDSYEPVSTFFEVGKTYRLPPHFDMRVEAIIERDGKKAAACSYYAEDENRIGFIIWDSFKGWQEV